MCAEVDRPEGVDLDKLRIFKGLDPASSRGLLEECSVQELQPGEVLIRAEEINHSLYLVLSGRFRVHLDMDQDAVAMLTPGEVAGEISLISGEPTSAFVIADEISRVLVLDEKALWSLLDSSPLTSNLLLLLSKRLYGADRVIKEQVRLKSELEEYAIADALTGLHNRRWLEKMLPRFMQRAKRSGGGFSLILFRIIPPSEDDQIAESIDLNELLYAVSRKIMDSLRPGEIVIRAGNEDFIVLLAGTDALTANKVGGRLCRGVMNLSFSDIAGGENLSVTMTYGVAEMTDEDTSGTLVREAENDLHTAGA
ncbi:MAG: GGDEF domain-containing protein [Acidobacteriota bacterium]